MKSQNLEKGIEIYLEKGVFPISKAKFIGKDCGNFLHLIEKTENYIYGLFLKEDNCYIEDGILRYNGTKTPLNIRKVNINSSFGQKLKHKYLNKNR